MIQNALVVDDSKSARFMLCKMLERNGLSVASSESAEEAIAYLADHAPDVIFMDHMMPGMDGLEATRTIKLDPRFAATPVVLFTSKEGPQYRRDALEHGAVDVLPKPPSAETVAAMLERLNAQVEEVALATEAGGAVDEDAIRALVAHQVDELLGETIAGRIDDLLKERIAALEAGLGESMRRSEEATTDTLMAVVDERMKAVGKEIVADATAHVAPAVDERLASFSSEILEQAEQRITPVVEISTRINTESVVESSLAAMRDEFQAAVDRSVAEIAGRVELHRDEISQRIGELARRVEQSATPKQAGGGEKVDLDGRILELSTQMVERAFERHGKDLSTAAQRDAGAIAGQMVERQVAKLSEELRQGTDAAARRAAGSARLYAVIAALVGIAAAAASAYLF